VCKAGFAAKGPKKNISLALCQRPFQPIGQNVKYLKVPGVEYFSFVSDLLIKATVHVV